MSDQYIIDMKRIRIDEELGWRITIQDVPGFIFHPNMGRALSEVPMLIRAWKETIEYLKGKNERT